MECSLRESCLDDDDKKSILEVREMLTYLYMYGDVLEISAFPTHLPHSNSRQPRRNLPIPIMSKGAEADTCLVREDGV